MSVICAVCSIPLYRGEAFALDGCSVVHRACLGQRVLHDRQMDDIREKVRKLDQEIYRERDQAAKREQDLRYMMGLAEARARTAERQLDLLAQQRQAAPTTVAVPVASPPVEIVEPEQIPVATPDDTALRFALLELD